MTEMIDDSCVDANGYYLNGGIGNCWGMTVGALQEDNWVDVAAWLFMPKVNADENTLGYRFTNLEEVKVRIVMEGVGNMESTVTLQGALKLGLQVTTATLALILYF